MWQIEDSVVQDLVRRKQDLTAIDYYGDVFSRSSQPDSVNSTEES